MFPLCPVTIIKCCYHYIYVQCSKIQQMSYVDCICPQFAKLKFLREIESQIQSKWEREKTFEVDSAVVCTSAMLFTIFDVQSDWASVRCDCSQTSFFFSLLHSMLLPAHLVSPVGRTPKVSSHCSLNDHESVYGASAHLKLPLQGRQVLCDLSVSLYERPPPSWSHFHDVKGEPTCQHCVRYCATVVFISVLPCTGCPMSNCHA